MYFLTFCFLIFQVFPTYLAQIGYSRDDLSRIDFRFIEHLIIDEESLSSKCFEKLLESDFATELTFRCPSKQSPALSTETFKYIGLLLQRQSKLRNFKFDSHVGNEGIFPGLPYICHGLSTNSGLQNVEISIRSLYDAEQLGKGLATNKSIQRLKIYEVSSEPLLKLLDQLRDNQSITDMHIENCPLLQAQKCRA